MKIYVVRGTTGDYSDREEWGVCAYTDERKAEKHADLASEYALKFRKKYWRDDEKHYGLVVPESEIVDNSNKWLPIFKSPYDLYFRLDDKRTDYYIEGVELREELPTPMS